MYITTLGFFFWRFGNPNSVPHVWIASTLYSKPSPQPTMVHFFFFKWEFSIWKETMILYNQILWCMYLKLNQHTHTHIYTRQMCSVINSLENINLVKIKIRLLNPACLPAAGLSGPTLHTEALHCWLLVGPDSEGPWGNRQTNRNKAQCWEPRRYCASTYPLMEPSSFPVSQLLNNMSHSASTGFLQMYIIYVKLKCVHCYLIQMVNIHQEKTCRELYRSIFKMSRAVKMKRNPQPSSNKSHTRCLHHWLSS